MRGRRLDAVLLLSLRGGRNYRPLKIAPIPVVVLDEDAGLCFFEMNRIYAGVGLPDLRARAALLQAVRNLDGNCDTGPAVDVVGRNDDVISAPCDELVRPRRLEMDGKRESVFPTALVDHLDRTGGLILAVLVGDLEVRDFRAGQVLEDRLGAVEGKFTKRARDNDRDVLTGWGPDHRGHRRRGHIIVKQFPILQPRDFRRKPAQRAMLDRFRPVRNRDSRRVIMTTAGRRVGRIPASLPWEEHGQGRSWSKGGCPRRRCASSVLGRADRLTGIRGALYAYRRSCIVPLADREISNFAAPVTTAIPAFHPRSGLAYRRRVFAELLELSTMTGRPVRSARTSRLDDDVAEPLRVSSWISGCFRVTWQAHVGYIATRRPMSETNQPASRTWSSRSFSITGRTVRATAFQPFESTLTNASTSC